MPENFEAKIMEHKLRVKSRRRGINICSAKGETPMAESVAIEPLNRLRNTCISRTEQFY